MISKDELLKHAETAVRIAEEVLFKLDDTALNDDAVGPLAAAIFNKIAEAGGTY
jgi:hypothetical protein